MGRHLLALRSRTTTRQDTEEGGGGLTDFAELYHPQSAGKGSPIICPQECQIFRVPLRGKPLTVGLIRMTEWGQVNQTERTRP